MLPQLAVREAQCPNDLPPERRNQHLISRQKLWRCPCQVHLIGVQFDRLLCLQVRIFWRKGMLLTPKCLVFLCGPWLHVASVASMVRRSHVRFINPTCAPRHDTHPRKNPNILSSHTPRHPASPLKGLLVGTILRENGELFHHNYSTVHPFETLAFGKRFLLLTL